MAVACFNRVVDASAVDQSRNLFLYSSSPAKLVGSLFSHPAQTDRQTERNGRATKQQMDTQQR
jgi:hypothetical protein